MRIYFRLIMLLIVGVVGGVSAADRFPAVVDAALKASYPTAKVLETEKEVVKGETFYEAELEQGERRFDVLFSAAGKLVAEEEWMEQEDLPAGAKRLLKKSFAKATISEVEKVTRDAVETYEVEGVLNGRAFEIRIDGDGVILDLMLDDEGDDDK